MDAAELKRLASSVDGLCSEDVCYVVYSLARDIDARGVILELGGFKGRITVCLAKAVEEKKEGRVYTVDANILGTKDVLLKNIGKFGVKEWVTPIFADSVKANRGWDKPIRLIWLDNNVNYITAICDFILWEPFLSLGGAIVFNRPEEPHIKRFIDNYIAGGGRFQGITIASSVVYAYKNKQTPPYPGWKKGLIKLFYIGYHFIRTTSYRLSDTISRRLKGRGAVVKEIINRFSEWLLRIFHI